MNTDQTVGEYIVELLQYKADADRYRYLRDVADPGDWSWLSYQDPDVIDATIDAEK